MAPSVCVTREELSDYCSGILPPERVEEVADHVEQCSTCDQTLRQFEAQGDPLFSTLRSTLADEYLQEPELARMMQVAAAIVPGGSPSSKTPAILPNVGDWLRDYRLLVKLGQGGMGTVYKAIHTHLEKVVAVKFLPSDRMRDEQAVARFRREMKAVGKLDHPNIVRALDAGEDGGRHFLVMEFVDGFDLACVSSRRGTLRAADACELARQAALGLDYAHRHGLVHRDIKPSNLMLTPDGQSKILDLGLALLNDDAGGELTGTEQLMGTAEYMAPEQADDSHKVDGRADLYSLGCTLYKLLTGEAPFSGPAYATRLQKLLAHVNVPAPLLSQRRPDVDGALTAILERLSSKQPSARFATGGDLAAALTPFCAGANLPALYAALASGAATPLQSAKTDPYLSSASHGTDSAMREQGAGNRAQEEGSGDDEAMLPLPLGEGRGEGGLETDREQEAHRDEAAKSVSPPLRRRVGTLLAVAGAAFALLAGAVFYVQTKDGKIRVEINDPQIGVAIKDTTITFQQADSGTDVRVSPGEKTLIVERGDFKFETDKLLLKRGDTVTVSVTLLAGEVEVKQGDQVIGHEKLPTGWYGWAVDAPAPAIAPFDAAQAKKHQQEWADYLKLPAERTNTVGMKFVLIPPGEFLMGSTAEEIDEAVKDAGDNKGWQEEIRSEAARHKVILTQPFYMAVHEVTQKEYEAVMGNNPSSFAKANHPVDTASYADAAEFCARLSRQEKLKPFYFRAGETVTPVLKGNGYRLPTEAEWEFACRAGTATRFWNGNESPAGWWGGNSGGRTHEVEELANNPFGLFDVHGNVSEWTDDSWDPKFYDRFAENPAIDPSVLFYVGSRRVMRGGDWGDLAAHCRSANRYAYDPSLGSDHYIGFRVVLAVQSVR